MDKIHKSQRFKFIVRKVIDQRNNELAKSSPDPTPQSNSSPPRRASFLDSFKRAANNLIGKDRKMRRVATEKQLSPPASLFSNLKTLKLGQNISSPPKLKREGSSKFSSLVTTLLKNKRKSESVLVKAKTMGPEEVKKKFMRAFQILRVIRRLNMISEDIHLYGTSSNLFDLTTRDRTRVKRILYPGLLNEEEETAKEEKSMKWYTIHPKSKLRLGWTFVVLFLLTYTATITPYRLTFEEHTPIGWRVIDYIIDALFFTDLLMNFISAYYDDEGKLVKEPKQLAKVYLKSWFLIDLIAVIPLDAIIDGLVEDSTGYSKVRYNLFLRLIRLPRLYRLLRILRINNIAKFIRGTPFLEWLELHSIVLRLMTFFIITATLVHIMACIWYFEAKLDSNPSNWVTRYFFLENTNASLYLTSLYYVISTIATVGYGDIFSGTVPEQILSILLMLLGAGFYSYTVGIMASIFSSRENRLASLKRKISIANEFAHEIKASKVLKRRIRKILEYNSLRNCFSWANKKEVFSEIPIPLRFEIVMTMHSEIFTTIPFFREHSDKYFVVTIIELLKPLQVSARDFLWKEGDSAESIYFLISGKVHMLSSEFLTPTDRVINQKTSIIFNRYPAGSYFGEIEIIEKTNRAFSLQAGRDSEVFYLTKHDYYNVIVQEFPHIHEEFTEIATERNLRNLECINEIRAFLHAHIPETRRQNSKMFGSPALSSKRLLQKASRSMEKSPRLPSLSKLSKLPSQSEDHKKKDIPSLCSVEPLENLERKDSNITTIDHHGPHIPEIKLSNLASPSQASTPTPKKYPTFRPHHRSQTLPPIDPRRPVPRPGPEGAAGLGDSPSPNKTKVSSIFSFLAQQNQNNNDTEVELVQKISNASNKSHKTNKTKGSFSRASGSLSSITSDSDSQPSEKAKTEMDLTPKNNKSSSTISVTSSPHYKRLSGLLADRMSRGSRSSLGNVFGGDSTPTRMKFAKLNQMMRVGLMMSDPHIELDEDLKKRRSKEVSFLKMYVGADSEQSSPLLEPKSGGLSPEVKLEKKKSLKKQEREAYSTKQALNKEQKRGKEDAKIMRKEIQNSEFRIKALEDKVHSMMDDLKSLI